VDGQKIIVLQITNSTRDINLLETELQTPKICSKEVRVSCESAFTDGAGQHFMR
jgi:hypothetical protein